MKSGTYKGTTSEHSPVTFKIANRTIRNFSTADYYNGSCGQGGGPGFTIAVKSIKIGRDGKFSANLTLVGPVKAVKNEKGKLTGKASGGIVTGTIVTLSQEHGGTFCSHGYNEKFTAPKS